MISSWQGLGGREKGLNRWSIFCNEIGEAYFRMGEFLRH